MKKIRIKARVVPQPCIYRNTCCGACDWCKTHSYSEACVPMLQRQVQETPPLSWWKAERDEHEICATEFTCNNCKVTLCRSDMTDKEFATSMKYCPNCGARMMVTAW